MIPLLLGRPGSERSRGFPVSPGEGADKDFEATTGLAAPLSFLAALLKLGGFLIGRSGAFGWGESQLQPQCQVSVTLALAYFGSEEGPTQRVSEERQEQELGLPEGLTPRDTKTGGPGGRSWGQEVGVVGRSLLPAETFQVTWLTVAVPQQLSPRPTSPGVEPSRDKQACPGCTWGGAECMNGAGESEQRSHFWDRDQPGRGKKGSA